MALSVNKHLRRIAAGLSALLIVLLGLASNVRATPSDGSVLATSSRFTLTSEFDNISEISSPQAYRTTSALFLDNSATPLQLTDIRYYVVKGYIGPDGEYRYPFKVHADADIQVGGIELAVNPSDHTQLMAVGIPTAASSAAIDQRSGIASQQVKTSVLAPPRALVPLRFT